MPMESMPSMLFDILSDFRPISSCSGFVYSLSCSGKFMCMYIYIYIYIYAKQKHLGRKKL